MNSRGQALVEFIVILPILLTIIICMIDFGSILYKKYSMENDLDYVVDLYNSDKLYEINSYVGERKLKFSYKEEVDKTLISLTNNFTVNAPILSSVLGNPYKITVERYIYE